MSTAKVANSYARQAICTRYSNPSGQARIIVTAEAGRLVIPWNHELDVFANHSAAAEAFAAKWGWKGKLVGGGLPKNDGYAFCLLVD